MQKDANQRRRFSPKPPVLVVDDDAVTLGMLEAQLKDRGYPVCLARNGVEAMSVISRSGARIVLSDCMMPEMNRLELCRRIKSIPDSPFIYFIMLTIQHDLDRLVEA